MSGQSIDRIYYEVWTYSGSPEDRKTPILTTFSKEEAEKKKLTSSANYTIKAHVLQSDDILTIKNAALKKLSGIEALVLQEYYKKPSYTGIRGAKKEKEEVRVWDHTEGNRG